MTDLSPFAWTLKIKNENKDISYIKGANHNYTGKEEELAEEIEKFIEKYDLNKN